MDSIRQVDVDLALLEPMSATVVFWGDRFWRANVGYLLAVCATVELILSSLLLLKHSSHFNYLLRNTYRPSINILENKLPSIKDQGQTERC